MFASTGLAGAIAKYEDTEAGGFLPATVSVAVCAAWGAAPGYETVTEHDFFGPSATHPEQRFEVITNPAVEGLFDRLTVSAPVELPPMLVNTTFCDDPDVNMIGLAALDDGVAVNTGDPPAHAPNTTNTDPPTTATNTNSARSPRRLAHNDITLSPPRPGRRRTPQATTSPKHARQRNPPPQTRSARCSTPTLPAMRHQSSRTHDNPPTPPHQTTPNSQAAARRQ
jgi:hypothetical protein